MRDFDRLRRASVVTQRDAARIKRDVEEELQSHIDMRATALERGGMSPRDARDRAQREFGDLDEAAAYCTTVDQSTEQQRRASTWLAEVRQDVAHALRLLRRAPAFTAATVLTLALAFGASTAVYAVLHAYLIQPLPFPYAERLVSLMPAPSRDFRNGPSFAKVDWTRTDSLFDATASWDLDGFTLSGAPQPEIVSGAWVTPGYFQAVGLRPALGRGFLPNEFRERAPVAIISHELWTRRFHSDSGILGRVIAASSADNPEAPPSVTIIGVAPRGFWPIQWSVSDLLRPVAPENDMPYLARLKPDMSLQVAQRQLTALVRAQVSGPVDPAWHMTLESARDNHAARVRPLLMSMFGAVLFMLLAACGSVAGALVSRTAARRSELSLRLALGGSRARIVRQLLTESAVLATLAGALGLIFAFVLLVGWAPLVEQQLSTSTPGGASALRPTVSVMLQAASVCVLAGIALGLVPALTFLGRDSRAVRASDVGATRGVSAVSSGTHTRRILIASQVMVATVLLFGAGLMFRTIAQITSTDLGFRTDGVMVASTLLPLTPYPDSAAKRLVMDRLLTRLAETPGVRAAAAVYPLPFGSHGGFPILTEGAGTDEATAPRTAVYTISTGYLNTMGIPLRTGRNFADTDNEHAPLVVIVSDALARKLAPGGNVIGRRIRVRVAYASNYEDKDDRPWRTVVGVVGNTRKDFMANTTPNESDVYVPYAQSPRSRQSFVVRTDRAETLMGDVIRRAVASVDPSLALGSVSTMTSVVSSYSAERRAVTVLLGAFAAFTLVLSALALYASLSYTVVQRRIELAIRMAVGAGAPSILRLVATECLLTTAFGVAGGVAASLALGRVLEHQVYGVATSDPATLLSISVVLAVTAVAACLLPSLRAIRTDPALALRT